MFRNLHQLFLCVAITSTFSLPVYAATTILPGEIFENTGYTYNYDQLNNQGHLINSGTIDNMGAYYPYGAQFNNWGVTDNSGRFNLYQNSSLNNYGQFNNDINGWIDLQSGSNILNTGIFNNNGNIYGQYNYGLPNSELINTNTLNNYRDIRNVDINNAGNINNQYIVSSQSLLNNVAGVVNNFATGFLDIVKEFTNYGILNNDGQLTLSSYTNEGSLLVNSGTVNNSGYISAQTNNAKINNSGLINNDGYINTGYDFVINNSGTFNNGSVFDLRPGITSYSASLEINNSGVFNNNLFIEAKNLTINNSGVFENNSSVMLRVLNNQLGGVFNNHREILFNSNNSYPLLMPEMNNAGEFNNYGVMSIATDGQFVLNNAGTFNQYGQIDNRSGSIILNNEGTFNNGSAYIAGFSLRLGELNNYGEFNNWRSVNTSVLNNSGTFNDLGWGSSSVFSLVNSGAVTLRNDFVIERFTNQLTGVVNNYADGSWYNGLTVNQEFNNQGTINNAGQLTINQYGAGTVNNAGTINNARDAEITLNSYSNSNTGVINNHGAIRVQSPAAFVNDGTITGAGEFNGHLVITEAGTLAPSIDLMNFWQGMRIYGDVDLDGTFAINSNPDTSFFSPFGMPHVQTDIYGFVTLGENSVLDISILEGSYYYLGQSFDLMSAYDISGSFGNFYYDSLLDNTLSLQWEILEGYGLGDLLRVSVVTAVPVPAAVWLFMSGLAGLIVVSRRREKKLH